MPTSNFGAPPIQGVPHVANKLIMAPKQRQNQLNVRVAPVKRSQIQVKPLKADKPGNVGNF